MSGNRKYLKFGLRADNNLADLGDQSSALGNVLDNLDKGIVDVFGNPVGFRVEDVVPIQNLSQTDLDATVSSSGGIPQAWTWLREEIKFETVADETGATSNISIQPLITLQDEINKFKTILGDPPFIGGGTGPIATVIPGNRLNVYAPGDDNEEIDTAYIKKDQRYRITDLGSVTNPGGWDTIAGSTKGSNYTLDDYFVASTNLIHTFSFSDINDSNETIFLGVNHGLLNGVEVKYLENGGTSITNLTNDSNYFVVANDQSAGTVTLSGSSGGPSVDFTKPAEGSGNGYTLSLVGYTTGKVRNITMPAGNFATLAQDISPQKLKSNFVYTKQANVNLTDLITETDFWNDQNIIADKSDKLRDNFPDHFGGVQFEGYMERGFNPSITTNGFITLEQDLVEDGTDNNWTLIQGTNTDRLRTFHRASWGTASGKTRITFTNEEDVRRVARGMRVILNGDAYAAQLAIDSTDTDALLAVGRAEGTIGAVSVSGMYADLTEQVQVVLTDGGSPQDTTGTSSYDIAFNWDLGLTELRYNVSIARPVGTRRRRIRFTSWWPQRNIAQPDPIYGSENQRREVSSTDGKSLKDVSGQGNFTYTSFYPSQNNQDFSNKTYSFPFFRDKRASVLQQDSDNELKVKYTTRNEYTPVKYIADAVTYYEPDNNSPYSTYGAVDRVGVIPIQVKGNGQLTWAGFNATEAGEISVISIANWSVGDFIVVHNDSSGTYHAFKILEVDADRLSILVDSSYASITGIAVDTIHRVMIIKNNGLHGIYKYSYNSALTFDDSAVVGGTTDTITISGHGINNLEKVQLTNGSGGNVGVAGTYFANINGNVIKLYDSKTNAIAGGTTGRLDLTSQGSGHTLQVTPNHKITQLDSGGTSFSYHVNEVRKEDFVFKIDYDDTSNLPTNSNRKYAKANEIAFKLSEIDHGDALPSTVTSANFSVEAHNQASDFSTTSQSVSQANGIIICYGSKGLIDRSSVSECTDVFGHEVASSAASGQNIITLKSVEGITPGDIVHLEGTIPFDANNPTVVGTVNSGTKQITVVDSSTPTAQDVDLSVEAPPGTTIVFVPASAGPNFDGWGKQNKEYCVTPLNTAPPWAGTNEGLETTNSFPNIVAKEFRFTDLNFEDVPVNTIEDYTDSSPTTASKYFIISSVS